MDCEHLATTGGNHADKLEQALVVALRVFETSSHGTLAIFDTDAHFDCDRHGDTRAHRRDTIRDQLRLRHEARPERTRPDAIAGTSDVEIDLVVARLRTLLGRQRKALRIVTAELQGQWMFS